MGQFGELGRQQFLLVLQGGEFHFHEFVVVEGFVQARDERVAQTGIAHAGDGFEKLAQAL